ncbi:MAG: enoyl-CoA hydratase/isomerase family protein [Chloroflexi bacterium]|nr:enoyl-CoA hydratase/isomerase family protein [Chloroflexota bacterium]
MTTTTDPTTTNDLLYEVDGHVGIITLNRPDRLNAISRAMLEALSAQLVACQKDREIRVVILTGSGRGFCSGLDLQEQGERLRQEGESDVSSGYSLFDWRDAPPTVIYRMDKPIICALNGAAAGYGMDIALLCDIRIASVNAKMGAVFAKRGVLPGSGGTWILPRLVGWHRAAEIAFRGRVLDAAESLEMGLLNKVVPHEDLMDEAMAWAREIANNAPLSVQATKRMMRLGWDETFEAAVDHIYLQLLPLMQSEDFKEGVASFLERREPHFQGR